MNDYSVNEIELKPCPFCGSPAKHNEDKKNEGYWYVDCTECDCNMLEEGWISADELWNRRPIEDALRAQVEALQEQLAEARVALEWYADIANYPGTSDARQYQSFVVSGITQAARAALAKLEAK